MGTARVVGLGAAPRTRARRRRAEVTLDDAVVEQIVARRTTVWYAVGLVFGVLWLASRSSCAALPLACAPERA